MRLTVMKSNPDYAVTRTGRVYSHKSGKWKELKPQFDTDGYSQVRLWNNGSNRLTFVHRIIAETFIPKPNGCTEINHIDGDKRNNDALNLEWCSRRDNIMHAHDTGLIKTRTPVVAIDLNTNEKTVFKGQHDAARSLGINQGNINHALKRNNGTCYGYRFSYLNSEVPEYD
jgi:hypothetical protein